MDAALTRARAAVFTVFGINGFLLAMWVVHIPVVQQRVGVGHAALGTLLLALAVGALMGMQATGYLADRFGSNRTTVLFAAILAVAVIGPGLATAPWQLAVALVVFGFANGALDVSMNSQAVLVERRYHRPIMAAFHGLFSMGGIAGSLVGAATLAVGIDPPVTLAAAGAVGLAAILWSAPRLVPSEPTPHVPAESSAGGSSMRVILLGGVAFGLMLSEGVANDWSALQVKEHLGASDSVAALAFGAFSATMTLGRFVADRVSARIGGVAVVRFGTLAAAAGMALVMTSPGVPTTLVGWALFGLGLSGAVPQIFTAAGNIATGTPGKNMSRVVGLGYIGFLAGPAAIGWISEVSSLTVAMVVPLVCVLVAAALAPALK
ncbi:MFS transporter [Rhodococcus sp. HNM0563]|uniref:MFS transporter n=1 Tax=unclassified Rhodococcus (in: high G+C Gram-positive bacteria) TaxID=192944 RepID=UPI00146B7D78|nr:MFS transporter [Rhodococcus sp. F64268]MCK0092656.1 MFS transporter [Rhodococcus sp. F64268]NLU64426.1 MFS transporter [Rhodococcus sp. HNM0563]